MMLIERVRNGFIITTQGHSEGDPEVDVIQIGDLERSEAEAAAELASAVLNFFGLEGSKYSSLRPYIILAPGEHFESQLEECPLCFRKNINEDPC